MIWRTIQVIGVFMIIVGFGAFTQGKTWWVSVAIIGVLLLIFGKAMRFITKDK